MPGLPSSHIPGWVKQGKEDPLARTSDHYTQKTEHRTQVDQTYPMQLCKASVRLTLSFGWRVSSSLNDQSKTPSTKQSDEPTRRRHAPCRTTHKTSAAYIPNFSCLAPQHIEEVSPTARKPGARAACCPALMQDGWSAEPAKGGS